MGLYRLSFTTAIVTNCCRGIKDGVPRCGLPVRILKQTASEQTVTMKLSIGLLGAVLLMLLQGALCALKLPRTSIPTKYELTLDFSVSGSRTINGNVKIDIKIVEDTDSIVLNSRGLAVTSVKVTTASDELENIFKLQPENEFLVINVTSRPLFKDETLKLEIDFTGLLQTNSTKGIYRAPYKLNNSATRYARYQFYLRQQNIIKT